MKKKKRRSKRPSEGKRCLYRAGLPCLQPHLRCDICPHRMDAKKYPLEGSKDVFNIFRELGNMPLPYIKMRDSYGKPAIEAGLRLKF